MGLTIIDIVSDMSCCITYFKFQYTERVSISFFNCSFASRLLFTSFYFVLLLLFYFFLNTLMGSL